DDFFALGGHSLLATRVISRVRARLGVELPLRALFDGPTVASLADAVEAARRAEPPPLPPVVPVGRDRALPLSFAQERLWFLDRLMPGATFYNIPVALRLSGALDRAALERSLGEILRRHEALRTTFREVDGVPVQVIAPFRGYWLPLEELPAGDGEAREERALRRAREVAERPFDLAAGPPFRATLLRLDEADHVLVVCTHHVASDGWSTGVFFRELSALYAAYRDGAASPLPEPAVQYADYAVWQRERLAGDALARPLAYWRERLADAPELLELPTDHPRPAERTYGGARERFVLTDALRERLEALGRKEGATLFMVLLAAFQVLLSKYARSEDVVVGSPIAGRTRREVEELIGFFVNLLVLRTDLSGDPPFREALRRVREATLGAYEHQEVPFERLVEELRPRRALGHSPLFQVLFTLQSADRADAALPEMRVRPLDVEPEVARFDLSLVVIPDGRGLRGSLEYSTALFDAATIRRMLGHLEALLARVADDADPRLSELPPFSPHERRLVVQSGIRGNAGRLPGLRSRAPGGARAGETPDGVPPRNALSAPADAVTRDRYVAPRTPMEELLAAIWAEVLRIGRVGVHDDFFELGGSSVDADRVAAWIGEALGVDVGVEALTEHPTIHRLARFLAEEDSADPADPAEGWVPVGAPSLSALLAEIDELPEEDVARVLGGYGDQQTAG
ncbi:MAG TPA: condensation domain-containing protein, partial [Longimicrobium sp.]|nr:condensation domain-containing protein [Longimicrobium sp.]